MRCIVPPGRGRLAGQCSILMPADRELAVPSPCPDDILSAAVQPHSLTLAWVLQLEVFLSAFLILNKAFGGVGSCPSFGWGERGMCGTPAAHQGYIPMIQDEQFFCFTHRFRRIPPPPKKQRGLVRRSTHERSCLRWTVVALRVRMILRFSNEYFCCCALGAAPCRAVNEALLFPPRLC